MSPNAPSLIPRRSSTMTRCGTAVTSQDSLISDGARPLNRRQRVKRDSGGSETRQLHRNRVVAQERR
jgi:hypothetical protein